MALFAVSGAVFLPEALNRFVFPKATVVAVALALAAGVPARGRLRRAAVVLLVVAAVDLLVAALTSVSPLQALIGRAPRYEGVLVLPLYLGAAVAGARLLGPGRAPDSMAWFLDWLAVAALAIAGLAVLETAGVRPLTSDIARPGSLLGNASDEGAWAVLALGPLTMAALRAREPLPVAGALGAAVVLVCSGSRGALLGAVAGFAVLAVLMPRRAQSLTVAAIVIAVAVATLTLPTTRGRVLETAPLTSETVTGRQLLWKETLSLVGAHPLLGLGPSGYADSIPRYHDHRWAIQVGPANPPDSPHNWILQSAAAGGVPLALIAVVLALLTLACGAAGAWEERASERSAPLGGMLAGVAGYATALLFHFTSPGTAPLAALFAGALLSTVPARGLVRRRRAALSGACAVASGLLAVVLSCAAAAELPLRLATVAAAKGEVERANHDFDAASLLRPWDGAVAADAANNFAILATHGVRGAAAAGARWSHRALDADRQSIAALADGAAVALARGEAARAAALLSRALRLDPTNSDLYVAAAAAASARGLHRVVAADLHAAAYFTPAR